MIDPGLKGKAVAITGAHNPRGIGAAAARAFARQGADIFLHYFQSPAPEMGGETGDRAEPGERLYRELNAGSCAEVLESLKPFGGKTAAWEADLSDPAVIPDLFDQAEKALGGVDILINNAAAWTADSLIPPGFTLPNPLVEEWTDRPAQVTAGSVGANFNVNAQAVVLLMAEFLNRQIAAGKEWGRIINISTDGAHCFPSEISYGASKLALEGYSRSAAVELGQFGITVNVISPGPTQTGWITPALEQKLAQETPLGRIGKPEDVADAAVFLASKQARWITGQVIHVGGGHPI